MVIIIGHRGAAGLAPENTIPAIKKGIRYADMIEFDLQPTLDQKIVLFHDRDDISRTTNSTGKIPELTLKFLKTLDAGSWFSEEYTNTRISTFKEILQIVPTNILLNIELKFYDPSSEWFEIQIIDHLKKNNLISNSFIAVRYTESIKRLQMLESKIKCILLQKEREESNYLQETIKYNLKYVQIRKRSLHKEFIEKCHNQGIKVFYFYTDDEEEMVKCIKMGVDGILTNYPNILNKIKKEKNFDTLPR